MKTLLQSKWLGGSLQLAGSEIVGNAYYVDSTNGASTNSGTSWDNALATVDQAIAKCTANAGDKIFIAPWHTETEAGVDTSIVTMSKAGVSLIGVCQGVQRPTFTFTDDGATFSVTAANCSIQGIKIISGVADCAVGLTLGAAADGAVIDNCIFTDGSATLDLLIGISVTADCDNIQIINNRFNATATATSDNAILLAGGSDNSLISGNIIYGTYTDGAILASAAASVNIAITDNVIGAIDAIGIGLNASTTGVLARNLIGANTTSIAAALPEVSAMFCFENYVTGLLAKSGIIFPAVDAD